MLEEIATTEFLISTALIIVPAYLANGMPPIFRDSTPIDRGRNFFDGRRILGDGKTVRGTLFGIFLGTVGGIVTAAVINLLADGYNIPMIYLVMSFVIACGSILGDLLGAFSKRRIGLARGAPAPGLDQLTFILIAFLLAYAINLQIQVIKMTPMMLLVLVIITPFIHLLANYLGYKIGKKMEPW